MIAYILKVSLCWLFFYGIYELFLKNKTFFKANRRYLLSTLIIGIVLPLLEFIPWKNESNVAYAIYPLLMEIDDLQAVVATKKVDKFNWYIVLYFIYAVGLIVSLTRFSLGIKRILDLYGTAEKSVRSGYTLVVTNQIHLPFSFFKWVFFSSKMKLSKDVENILEHEIEHIKGKHSIDVLTTELLKVIFWCSPMIYLYRNALKEVHEYLADHVVIKKSDKIAYKKLLLAQTNSGIQMALTHQFFNSHLKNRIKMINQKRSGRPTLVMYALGIPVLLLLVFAFTYSYQGGEGNSSAKATSEHISNSDLDDLKAFATMVSDTVPVAAGHSSLDNEIFKVVEEMPRFPGCEDLQGTAKEKEDCAKQKMLNFIYENLEYPKVAKEAGAEGVSVVQFVVTSAGNIEEINVVRKLTDELGESTRAIVEKMKALPKKWTPGYQSGEAVNVLYTLPVMYKLTDNENAPESTDEIVMSTGSVNGEVYKAVDEMPRFPGCESMAGNHVDKDQCAKQKLLEYIYENLKYPSEDRASGTEGMAVVQFVVVKDGTLKDIKIVRSLSKGTDAEVLKVVRSMNTLSDKWTPGNQAGKEVNVQYVLPVRFKLQGDKEKEQVSANDAKKLKALEESLNPLIYLDGEIYLEDMETIDTETIATINVMKGDKAVAGYGEKGKNGVIEITTKAKANERSLKPRDKVAQTVDGEKIILKSFNDKDSPLFIVDGEEYKAIDNEELHPDEIASINVLKGEVANAKYGNKALNGVVEITTKKSLNTELVKFGTPPYFPGCSDIIDAAEKDKCSKQNLLKFIYSNLTYPKIARDQGVEGMIVASFVIGEDGRVGNIKLVRTVKELSAAATAVVSKLAEEITWEPATKNGKPIKTDYNLPIRFKLQGEQKPTKVLNRITTCEELADEFEKGKCREEKAGIVKVALNKIESADRVGEELTLENVSIYPNPAKESVNLRFSAEKVPTNIQILSVDGRAIYSKNIQNFDGRFEELIDLKDTQAKILVVFVEQNGKIFTEKIIVE